jgi:hypothetical protein
MQYQIKDKHLTLDIKQILPLTTSPTTTTHQITMQIMRNHQVTVHLLFNGRVVMFFYGPRYYRWSSPYYWGHYPHYWHSWSPFYYHNYYNHWYCGGAHWNGWWYRPSHHFYHHSHYHNHYYGHRKASQTVTVNVRNNNYQNTYVVQKNYKAGKSIFRAPTQDPAPDLAIH